MPALFGEQRPHLRDAPAALRTAAMKCVNVARAADAAADGLADLAVGYRIADAHEHTVANPGQFPLLDDATVVANDCQLTDRAWRRHMGSPDGCRRMTVVGLPIGAAAPNLPISVLRL